MSRTKRTATPDGRMFRKPRHANDERQLRQLLRDAYVEEYSVSKLNRIRKRLCDLPNAWDDTYISTVFDKHAVS